MAKYMVNGVANNELGVDWSVSGGATITPGFPSTTAAFSASTAGTYTVTYTVAASNGCSEVITTTTVTVTDVPTATISYSGNPFCTTITTPQPVLLSGTGAYLGGIYSATPNGLTLNTVTGDITPGTSAGGIYTVTYTIPASGGCSSVDVATLVTITTLPISTFSYTGSPYCSNGTNPFPAFSGGGVAGTFTALPSGLVFTNTATGEVDLAASTPGTYSVTNTIDASGGCPQVTSSGPITITELPAATISYTGNPFCITVSTPQPVTLNGTGAYTGGTYSSDPALSLDPVSGAITPSLSTAGTYTVTYTLPASGGCDAVAVTTPVTIGNTLAIPSIIGSTTVCEASLGYDYSTDPGMLNYIWTVSSGGSIAGGGTSTDNTISIDWNTVGAQTVTVTYTSPSGCSPVEPGVKDVTVNPRPDPSLNGAATVCAGVPGNVYITDPGMSIYFWYIPASGTVTAGGTSTDNTVTITWTSPGTAPLGVNYMNAYNCMALSATNLAVSVNYTPTALSLTGNTFCITPAGVGTITSTTSETGVSYQLYDAGNVAVQSPQDGTGSGLTWSNITPGTGYYVIGSATDNCTSTSNAVDVLTYPVPVPSISGPTPVCVTSTQTYTTETGMTGYNWLVSSGGIIIGATEAYLVNVRWDSPGVHTVSVNYIDANNCTAAEPTVYNVTVTPTVGTPTIITIAAGSEPTCQLTNGTTTTTYATTATNNTGFNWSLSNPSAGSIGATTGIMTWANGFSGSVDIQVIANGCNGPSAMVTRTVSITQTVGTPTAITISAGVEPTCQLTNGTTTTTYATTATNNTGISWSISNPSAGSIDATTGVMTWANGFYGTIDIQVIANGCNGPSAMVTRTVIVTQIPTATISYAGNPFCINITTPQPVTLNGTGAYTGGTYSADPSLSINTSTGAITPDLSLPGTYTVTYYIPASGGCDAVPVTTSVTIGNTIADPTINGSTVLCEASYGYDYTTEAGMLNYNWNVSAGGSIASGGTSTDNTISINWNTAGAQTVRVTYTSPSGCNPLNMGVIDVTVNPRPVPSLSGPVNACTNAIGNVYSTDPGMTTYYWYVPFSGIVTAGGSSTDNTITITWTSAGTQPLGVNYQNSFSCLALSATNLPVSVSPSPTELALTGNTICPYPGGNGIITSTTSEVGVSYQLFNAGNVAIQLPQTGTGSGLTWSGLAAGNGYYITGTGTNTCTSISNTVDVSTWIDPPLALTGSTICTNPGGTGKPRWLRSERFAPLPPLSSSRVARGSSKRNVCVIVQFQVLGLQVAGSRSLRRRASPSGSRSTAQRPLARSPLRHPRSNDSAGRWWRTIDRRTAGGRADAANARAGGRRTAEST